METTPEFEALLNYLKRDRGCDLTGYKRSSLMRRVQHRMQSIKIQSYGVYLQHLQTHAEEYQSLLDDVLINVTSFFRDRDTWDYLATHVIPKIITSKQPDEPIRVWSAGCASGQEIYSILILFAEALGIDACLDRVQGYATDVDEAVIQQARFGTYTTHEVRGVPSDLLEKYFESTNRGYVFHAALRRRVIFGRHHLAEDAPMSKIDLLICRNVLIYLKPDTQASILVRFHFALKNTGFLFLGKAEALTLHRKIFTPLDFRHRIYTKGLALNLEDHLSINPKSYRNQQFDTYEISTSPASQHRFWQTAFEKSPIAQLAVNHKHCLISANEQAMRLFGLTLNDWNRPLAELEPGKLLNAHASINALNQTHLTKLKQVEWRTANGLRYFDIAIAPVFNAHHRWLGVTVSFLEIPASRRRDEE